MLHFDFVIVIDFDYSYIGGFCCFGFLEKIKVMI